MKKTLLLLLCLWFAFGKLNAQEKDPSERPDYYWMQSSLGTGNSDLSADYSLHADLNGLYLGLAYSDYIDEFNFIFGPPSERLQTLSLKGGRIFQHRILYYGLNGGLGYAKFTDPRKVGETGGWFSSGIYEDDYYHLMDVSFQAMIGVKVLKISTINLSLGGNINSRSTQLYIRLGIGFGKFF